MNIKDIFAIIFIYGLGTTGAIADSNLLKNQNDINGKPINAHAGGMLYIKGTYYWYGEYRSKKPTDGMHWDSNQKVTMYESQDMKTWKYSGIVLDVSDSSKNWDLERPKIVYNKKYKRYVMWFHLEPNRKFTEGYAGVASSKNIRGPYKLINVSRPNMNIHPIKKYTPDPNDWFVKKADEKFNKFISSGQQVRDLTVFVDTDEKAYLIYESEDNYSLQVAELSDDYESFTGKYSRILVGKQNEAPTITKSNDNYYLITSGLTGYKPNPARVAESKSIFGPWKELGNPMAPNDLKSSETLFESQPSYLFHDPVSNKTILMLDKWDISDGGFENLWKSTYIWVQVKIVNGRPTVIR